MQLTAAYRVAILLSGGIKGEHGKTGLAFLRYSESQIVAIIDPESVGESITTLRGIERDVPIVGDMTTALTYSPDVLLIGIAPSGGKLPTAWSTDIKLAIQAGLSVVNGLHTPIRSLFSDEELQLQSGQWLWEVRGQARAVETEVKIGGARARSLSSQRILTVGTDISIGKMSTSLELTKLAQNKGYQAKFLATGQGGMMISGGGIPLDAIRVDFAAGAVEKMLLESAQENDDFLFVEGQGSLLHPGSTATLSLMRGSQPTGLILVHRADREHIRDFPEIPIPELSEVVTLHEMVASGAGAFGKVPVKGIALNTASMDEERAKEVIERTSEATGLPCDDVVRFSGESLFSALLTS